MTHYTIADRQWQTGPGGVRISVIPNRPVVHVVGAEKPSQNKRIEPSALRPRGETLTYITRYLTEHGRATLPQMAAANERVAKTALRVCLYGHLDLFEIVEHGSRWKNHPSVWRLRGGS